MNDFQQDGWKFRIHWQALKLAAKRLLVEQGPVALDVAGLFQAADAA